MGAKDDIRLPEKPTKLFTPPQKNFAHEPVDPVSFENLLTSILALRVICHLLSALFSVK
jgi:hypothetical protein